MAKFGFDLGQIGHGRHTVQVFAHTAVDALDDRRALFLSSVIREDLRDHIDVGPLPRGGDRDTLNNTGGSARQTSGPSFRIIADLSDRDLSVGANSPGQSGDPNSPHYDDLFQMWGDGQYFPLFYSRGKIESVTDSTLVLSPAVER